MTMLLLMMMTMMMNIRVSTSSLPKSFDLGPTELHTLGARNKKNEWTEKKQP